jgi:nitrate reductase NapE component
MERRSLSRSFEMLARVLVTLAWVGVVGSLGYVAIHFIVKY